MFFGTLSICKISSMLPFKVSKSISKILEALFSDKTLQKFTAKVDLPAPGIPLIAITSCFCTIFSKTTGTSFSAFSFFSKPLTFFGLLF